jgi:hypothetical protein
MVNRLSIKQNWKTNLASKGCTSHFLFSSLLLAWEKFTNPGSSLCHRDEGPIWIDLDHRFFLVNSLCPPLYVSLAITTDHLAHRAHRHLPPMVSNNFTTKSRSTN